MVLGVISIFFLQFRKNRRFCGGVLILFNNQSGNSEALFKGGSGGKMKMGTEALVLGTPGLPCLVALLRGLASKWNLSVGSLGTCHTWGSFLPNWM